MTLIDLHVTPASFAVHRQEAGESTWTPGAVRPEGN
jgi:hypothetical protein